MDYKKALENLRQYNREYSTGNELLESVVACINYIVEDSENESKDDLLEVAEIVKNDLLPKVEQPEYTHCDFPHLQAVRKVAYNGKAQAIVAEFGKRQHSPQMQPNRSTKVELLNQSADILPMQCWWQLKIVKWKLHKLGGLS